MVLDALSVAFGASLAGSAAALGWFFRQRNAAAEPARPRQTLTEGWRLRELKQPLLVAHDVEDLEVPPQTIVYASGTVHPSVLAACTVHQVPPVRTAFALDRDAGRALVFTGGVRDGSLALITEDPDLFGRLDTECRTIAARAASYVERLPVAALAGKAGVTVQTAGVVQEILPYRDQFMMRLEDQGAIIGVLVDRDPESLRDERILVEGRVEKPDNGYLVLHATDVRRLR